MTITPCHDCIEHGHDWPEQWGDAEHRAEFNLPLCDGCFDDRLDHQEAQEAHGLHYGEAEMMDAENYYPENDLHGFF